MRGNCVDPHEGCGAGKFEIAGTFDHIGVVVAEIWIDPGVNYDVVKIISACRVERASAAAALELHSPSCTEKTGRGDPEFV